MTPTKAAEDVLERLDTAERGLMVATVASCNCDHPASISPEPEGHTLECRYRVLIVAAHALADARGAITTLLERERRLRDELYVISELDGPNKAETVRQIHERARAALTREGEDGTRTR